MIQAMADLAITLLVGIAAWRDFTTHRIPNWLSVTGLATGLALRAPLGLHALEIGLEGVGLALAVSLLLYALRAIGGGDVKLLAAVGAFLGFPDVISALGVMAVLGGAFAIVSVTRRGLLPLLLLNTVDLVRSWRSLGRGPDARRLDSPGALTIPYAVPIAVGTLIWWFAGGVRL